MNKRHKTLLLVDAVVNLLLGGVLLFFPAGLLDWLGLPPTDTYFYASILGAVIFGIGVALLIERYGAVWGMHGLGLDGAIAINLCGSVALLVWLAASPLDMPLRGRVALWLVVFVVMGLGLIELAARRGLNRDEND